MSWSISEALTDPAIRKPLAFRSEFKFYLRDIPTEITVRLYNPIASSEVVVRQSHSIAVPGLERQATAECEDTTQDGEMLQSIVSQFTCAYDAAIAKGMKPDRSWLQPNPGFC